MIAEAFVANKISVFMPLLAALGGVWGASSAIAGASLAAAVSFLFLVRAALVDPTKHGAHSFDARVEALANAVESSEKPRDAPFEDLSPEEAKVRVGLVLAAAIMFDDLA